MLFGMVPLKTIIVPSQMGAGTGHRQGAEEFRENSRSVSGDSEWNERSPLVYNKSGMFKYRQLMFSLSWY